MSNIHVEMVSYDPVNTKIVINDTKPNVEIDIKNCNFAVGFDYHIKSWPELIEDSGTGKGWLKGLDIVVRGSPSVYNSFFQIEFGDLDLELEDFGIDINGGDLSILVDFFSDTVKTFIREYLLG